VRRRVRGAVGSTSPRLVGFWSVGVVVAAFGALAVVAVAIAPRRQGWSWGLAIIAAVVSVVVVADIGLSIAAPELEPRALQAISLGFAFPAGASLIPIVMIGQVRRTPPRGED
jgi:hypothetical protein